MSHATLLNAKVFQDGTHEGFGPLAEGEPVAKPVIEVDQTLVAGPCFLGVDNYTLFREESKGTLCI